MRMERLKSIKDAFLLGVMMLLGAAIGFLAAPFVVVAISGYDHGHETEEMAVWTIIGGALAGLGIHLARSSKAVG